MRILIVDDDGLLRAVLAHLVKSEGHAVLEARDGDEALEILERDPDIDVLFLDWMMPRLSGIETCRRARALARPRYLYVLLLTGKSDPEDVVGGLDAGADEYMVKPYRPGELKARLRSAQRVLDSHAGARAADARASYVLRHDVCTGVLNRTAIIAHVRERAERASVLRVDVDNFRALNERIGAAAGDLVLREVARRVCAAVPAAMVGRTGPDDFAAVLDNVDPAQARSLARRIVTSIGAEPISTAAAELDVSVSVEVVLPQRSLDVEYVLAAAEALGKHARGAEGGRVHTLGLP